MCPNCVQNLSEIEQSAAARVIDHLAHFRRLVLGGGALSPDCSLGCVDRTLNDTGRSWPSYDFVSELRYLAAFSNAGSQS